VLTGAGNDVRLSQMWRRQYPGSGLPPGVQRPYSGPEQIFPLIGQRDTVGEPAPTPSAEPGATPAPNGAPAKTGPYVPPLPPRSTPLPTATPR
jgi:hypothetical protein